MRGPILFVLFGAAIIVFVLMRHIRRRPRRFEMGGRHPSVERVRRPGKIDEFGKDVKWSIDDDD